jgi:hypothetical protein
VRVNLPAVVGGILALIFTAGIIGFGLLELAHGLASFIPH